MSRLDDYIVNTTDIMASTPEISIENIFLRIYVENTGHEKGFQDDYYEKEDSGYIERYKDKLNQLRKDESISYYLSEDRQYLRNDMALFENARDVFLKYINRVGPEKFEKLCAVLLYYEGFTDIIVTSQSKDGGIDFIAKKVFSNRLGTNLGSELTIFGQAKRYGKTIVGISSIRDFIGATEIVRCGGYKEVPNEIKIPKQNYSKHSPFSAQARIFITSGFFSKNAKKFAEFLGLRAVDGNELALILHHYNVGFIRSESNVRFDKSLYLSRIKQIYRDISLTNKLS